MFPPPESTCRWLLCAAGVLALSACASLTEKQCGQADWAELGRQDGEQGQPLSRLQEHRDNCARHGIRVDEAAWRKGHAQALRDYCTPRGGYISARLGDSYRQVCEAGIEGEFLEGFHRGREVHNLLREVRELQRRLEDAERRSLTMASSQEEAQRQRFRVAELSRRVQMRRRDLERLDRRYAERFSAPLLTEADMRY